MSVVIVDAHCRRHPETQTEGRTSTLRFPASAFGRWEICFVRQKHYAAVARHAPLWQQRARNDGRSDGVDLNLFVRPQMEPLPTNLPTAAFSWPEWKSCIDSS